MGVVTLLRLPYGIAALGSLSGYLQVGGRSYIMDEFHLDRWGLGYWYTVKADTLNGSCWLVRLCFLLPHHTHTHTHAHFYGYNTLPSSNPNHLTLTPTLTYNQFLPQSQTKSKPTRFMDLWGRTKSSPLPKNVLILLVHLSRTLSLFFMLFCILNVSLHVSNLFHSLREVSIQIRVLSVMYLTSHVIHTSYPSILSNMWRKI